jgi:hypothetical protein
MLAYEPQGFSPDSRGQAASIFITILVGFICSFHSRNNGFLSTSMSVSNNTDQMVGMSNSVVAMARWRMPYWIVSFMMHIKSISKELIRRKPGK